MKRFLCAGEGYGLFSTFNHYKPLIIFSLIFMCLQAAFANEPAPVSESDRAVLFHEEISIIPQQILLAGQVVDTAGRPIQGVTVTIKGSQAQTVTDADGNFSLLSPIPSGTMSITYIGYQPMEQSFSAGDTGPFRVMLRHKPSDLDEVVVIGYGQTSRRFNTGSVSTISAKEIEQQPVTNILSALSGRMPGVFVQTTNGLPGGNISIQIRGKGSIAAGTQPLYIIDGVPFDGAMIGESLGIMTQTMTGPISPLNNLNPQDIASITILKDADATAIYGSRGANGVVLITTKQGAGGTTKTSFHLQHGLSQSANLPRLMGLSDYLTMRREAFSNSGRTPSANPLSQDYAPDLMVWDTTRATDWAKYLLGGTGKRSTMNVGIRGGSANASFNLGANYHRETTVMPGDNDYQRGGLSFHLMHRSNDNRFTIGLSNNLTLGNNEYANLEAIMYQGIMLPPNYPLYLEDGEYNWRTTNPLAAQSARIHTLTNNYVTGINLSYTMFEGLDLKMTGGYNRAVTDQINKYPSSALRPGTTNSTNFGNFINQSIIVEPQIHYHYLRGHSDLQMMIGTAYQYQKEEDLIIQASDYINDALLENLGSASYINSKSTGESKYRYAAVFGRIGYIFSKRYIVNATVRRDGSSRFGPQDRFGTFGAVGVAWLFSDEPGMKDALPFLSFGKLKGSIGVTGNDQIPDYGYISTYSSAPYAYLGIPGLQPNRISNERFRWERTRKTDISTEMGFWNDRIRVHAGWYQNLSDNQLVQHPLPAITGFTSYQANMPATVENTGWEFELFTENINRKHFNWQTAFNISFEQNILKKFEGLESSAYANSLEIGYDISRIIGYRFMGLDAAGKTLFADKEGNIGSAPYYYNTLGKSKPDFYGGLSNTLEWGHWSLDMLFQFVKQESMGGVAGIPGRIAINSHQYYLDRWSETNVVGKLPGAYLIYDPYYERSSANLFDTSYIRFKTMVVTYRIPLEGIEVSGRKSIGFNLQGQNLLTFWDDSTPTFDPESGTGSLGGVRNVPPTRTIMIGLQLNF